MESSYKLDSFLLQSYVEIVINPCFLLIAQVYKTFSVKGFRISALVSLKFPVTFVVFKHYFIVFFFYLIDKSFYDSTRN